MLISHKHKFITINIPKTGSTSVNRVLRSHIHNNDVDICMLRKSGMRHATYEQCIAKFPNCKNYFTFSFVRNPWDRMVSFWFFKKYNAINKIDESLTFKSFLTGDSYLDNNQWLNQTCYIKNFENKSFIGRFENLQEDFDITCDKIGIPRQQLPHKNKTDHKHYVEYYEDETREIIYKKCKSDIKMFGYKFGE